jgi:hypothetical protein
MPEFERICIGEPLPQEEIMKFTGEEGKISK